MQKQLEKRITTFFAHLNRKNKKDLDTQNWGAEFGEREPSCSASMSIK